VELLFGMTLADMTIQKDNDKTNADIRLKSTHTLLESGKIYNEREERCGKVVRRCLPSLFDVRDASLDDDAFQ
jgi:hypothetical protein